MTQKLKVRIDGEYVAAAPGQSVLQVARAASKYIPALCYHPRTVRRYHERVPKPAPDDGVPHCLSDS